MMKKRICCLMFVMCVMLAGAGQALAVAVPINAGWQLETFNQIGSTQTFEFTLGNTGFFRVTDCCLTGDTFTVQIDAGPVDPSSAFAGEVLPSFGAPLHVTFQSSWEDSDFHKFEALLGPGSYSALVTITAADGGLPLALGVRVDSQIPEPATATLGLLALAGLLRRRRRLA